MDSSRNPYPVLSPHPNYVHPLKTKKNELTLLCRLNSYRAERAEVVESLIDALEKRFRVTNLTGAPGYVFPPGEGDAWE